jgi:phytoene synthase
MSETANIGDTHLFEGVVERQRRTVSEERLEQIRGAVEISREAVKAASITAIDILREIPAFIAGLDLEKELVNPFEHIEAPIWKEEAVPTEMIEAAFAYCELLTQQEAGNFYHSFKYLPDDQRQAMCAYYSFCRRADDIADGDYVDVFPGSVGADDPEAVEYRRSLEELTGEKSVLDAPAYRDKLAQLFFYRKKLSTAYNHHSSTDPIFMALKETATQFEVPKEYLDDLISGMEDDLYTNRYQTFEDLYRYCYRVASTVGLTCIEIYGYDDPRAKEYAESWGIFMQLTNILRDVAEDAQRNRVYLPIEDLERHGIKPRELSEDLSNDKRWHAFVAEFIERIEGYHKKGLKLLPLLNRKARYSPAAMMAFYSSILKKIKKKDGNVFHGTIKLTKAEKLTLAAIVYTKQRFLRL